MQSDCRIGLVEMESIVGDTEGNLNKILAKAKEAAEQGVSILCFPEMSLQGYSPVDAKALAEPLNTKNMERLQECAQDFNISLLIGMAEYGESFSKPFLSHAVIEPRGEIQVYRKTHLGRSEIEYFTQGDTFPVFSVNGCKFAIGICWDWHFPEIAAIYSLKGAEVLFAPHASPVVAGDRKEIWLRYLGARAYDNSVYLAACNMKGTNGLGRFFSGGSLVLGPKGEILGESFAEDQEILTVELSAERINHLRRHSRASMRDSFFLADRRRDIYQELLELEIPTD